MKDDQAIPKPKKSDILHEILHACFISQSNFDDFVCDPISERCDREVQEKADEISNALFDLYQLLGAKMVEEQVKEESK